MPTPRVRRQVDERLHELYRRHRPEVEGSVARYYTSERGYYGPELAGAERDQFAICLVTTDGEIYQAGDHDLRFPMQSISKVFTYGLALADRGRERVLERVGVEPSGDAFNSIVFDDRRKRPYNPMVNAGALVTSNLVAGGSPTERFERILDVMRRFAGNDELGVDSDVFDLEIVGADHNRATAYLMRSLGMMDEGVDDTLALYLRQCSVSVTCRDLGVMAATLANGCVNPVTGQRSLDRPWVRDVLSVMYTCGMYDYAGQWAFEVGVPAKSGVSGGILAVIPGKMGLGVFSPGLDAYGNSVRGVEVCREISERLGLHVFATEDEDAVLNPATPSPA